MRVLVVEDHEELANAVALGLRREGMAVDVALDGDGALSRAAINGYDVIVLDRDLPGIHGDRVCRLLSERGDRARVLMLTASAGIEDRVNGLGMGADDYLPKPFAFAELVARVRALVRRAQPSLPPVLSSGDIRLDPGNGERTDHSNGVGLGPSIVDSIARAHGAEIQTEARQGGGLDVRVVFPSAA